MIEHLLTEEYLNMPYSNNFLPLITKTISLTHQILLLRLTIFYTISDLDVAVGVALVDISDHLPVFCMLD